MGDLAPIAFDIETSGLDEDAVITVAGLAGELGEVIVLNTAGRHVKSADLEAALQSHSAGGISVHVVESEKALLNQLRTVAANTIDKDCHYLTAYNGETWNGGFDLPFLRSSCVQHSVEWPFPALAYADVFEYIDRFDTEASDLVGVYDELIGKESCDPFDDSGRAVTSFETGDWDSLLRHNLADIQRTRELAQLASQYVPQSDFGMKNLSPPNQ